MRVEEVKRQLKHIETHGRVALSHLNGEDFAYFRPADVQYLVAEVERLKGDNEELFGETERLKERVNELDGIAYTNGELYNKEYLKREEAEIRLRGADSMTAYWRVQYTHIEAERDRYKAALEKIGAKCDNQKECYCGIVRTAHDALDGAESALTRCRNEALEEAARALASGIKSYRSSVAQDEEGNGIELIDILATAYGDSDVGRAQREIELLADHLYCEICTLKTSPPKADEPQPAIAPETNEDAP